jgi:hypothetical protein
MTVPVLARHTAEQVAGLDVRAHAAMIELDVRNENPMWIADD